MNLVRRAAVAFPLVPFALTACTGSPALRCGEGTMEVAGECRPVLDGSTVDARDPATDAADAADAADAMGSSDATVPDEFVGISIEALDGLSVGGSPVQPVGVGVPTSFGVYGTYPDGTSRLLTGGVTFSVSPAGSGVELRAHDGIVVVTPSQVGDVQLMASATTASGIPLNANRRLSASMVQSPALVAITMQDGSWFSPGPGVIGSVDAVIDNLASSAAPLLPATAPAGTGVRVLTALAYTLTVHGSDGVDRMFTVDGLLDPAAVVYRFSAGAMTTPGLLTGDAPADVDVAVDYTLPASTTVLSATTRAHFVAPSAARGLLFTTGQPLVHWTTMSPLPVRTYGARSLALADFTNGTLDPGALAQVRFIGTDAGRELAVTLVAVHGTGADEYFEWLPWSAVQLEALSAASSFRVDPDGVFHMGDPGVGAWVARAGEFELPGLAVSPYPWGSSAALRIAPSPIAMTLPSQPTGPSTCLALSAFVTPPGGVERGLSALEGLAVGRFPSGGVSDIPVDISNPNGLSFCVQWFGGGGAARTGTFNFGFLGASTQVDARVTPGA